MQIIVPKRYVELSGTSKIPLFFLAGPVVGGGEWQVQMCKEIDAICPNAIVVVPNRWDSKHELAGFFMSATPEFETQSETRFPRQLNFEQYYLDEAGEYRNRGCIIFWLAEQKEPRPPEMGPYARDTGGELGEWRGRMMYRRNSIRVVIGAEPNFSGLDTVQRNFRCRVSYDFPFYTTMAETAAAAVKKASYLS